MPAETNESVAEHSTRLQPSINSHAPITVFMFTSAALVPNYPIYYPQRPDGTRIYNRSSSTVYMCIVVHSSKTRLVNLTWQITIQLEMAIASSKHSLKSRQVLEKVETHMWGGGGEFYAILMFCV